MTTARIEKVVTTPAVAEVSEERLLLELNREEAAALRALLGKTNCGEGAFDFLEMYDAIGSFGKGHFRVQNRTTYAEPWQTMGGSIRVTQR